MNKWPYWQKGALIGGILSLGLIVFKLAFFFRCSARDDMLGFCSLIFAFPFGFILKPVLSLLDYLPTVFLRQLFLLGLDILVVALLGAFIGWIYGKIKSTRPSSAGSDKSRHLKS